MLQKQRNIHQPLTQFLYWYKRYKRISLGVGGYSVAFVTFRQGVIFVYLANKDSSDYKTHE
jgi:hypothetical protein